MPTTETETRMSQESKTEGCKIVVGVDGTPASIHALSWAAEEASIRGCRLLAVRSWNYPVSTAEIPLYENYELLEEDVVKELEDELASVRKAFPDLEIETFVAQGSASKALFGAAKGAAMLVIGSKGHGGLANLLTGSVASHITHDSPVPVVVVPHLDPHAAGDQTG